MVTVCQNINKFEKLHKCRIQTAKGEGPNNHYIFWDLYFHVNCGNLGCFLPPLVRSGCCDDWRSSCKTPPAQKNETTPDTHHIIVISGEPLRPDRALPMWNSIWLHLGSARTLSAARWFKVTLCWARHVLLSACGISYHEVDLISIKWTLFYFSERDQTSLSCG